MFLVWPAFSSKNLCCRLFGEHAPGNSGIKTLAGIYSRTLLLTVLH
jgi:hypothetical protein